MNKAPHPCSEGSTRKMRRTVLLLSLLLPLFAVADTETVDGITWTYSVYSGKAFLSSGTIPRTTSGSVTIPATLGGFPVTSIGNFTFSGCSGLTAVTIPDGVTSIGNSIFNSCSKLKSVTIPNSVENVSSSAFSGSALESVFIPDSLATQASSWNLPSGCNVFVDCVTVGGARIPKFWIYEHCLGRKPPANDDWLAAARSVAANGVNTVWECYVAGLDPAVATNRFLVNVDFDESGRRTVSWTPDLENERDYAVDGKASLSDGWGEADDGSRFFRVRVAMPGGFGDGTISFDATGGSSVTSITAAVGAELTPPTEPTKTGYLFVRWVPSFPETMPAGSLTLAAQWTPISYSVRFNPNGGVGTMTNEAFVYDTAKTLTLNAFGRAGYIFNGWATSATGASRYDDGQTVQNLSSISDDVVDLYATWVPASGDLLYSAAIPLGYQPTASDIVNYVATPISDELLRAGITVSVPCPPDGTTTVFFAVPVSYRTKINWLTADGSVGQAPSEDRHWVVTGINGQSYDTYDWGADLGYYGTQTFLLKLKNQ